MLQANSHTIVVVAMIALAAVGAFVLKALWVTFQTISEQQADPSPVTPVLLTVGMVMALAGLMYLVYLTQAAATA